MKKTAQEIAREECHERALRAASALRHYSEVQGETGNDLQTLMVDLFADIMHLANEQNIDVEGAYRSAEGHCEEELFETREELI
jgi:hypothetical protein